jgi:hypothetical protein
VFIAGTAAGFMSDLCTDFRVQVYGKVTKASDMPLHV